MYALEVIRCGDKNVLPNRAGTMMKMFDFWVHAKSGVSRIFMSMNTSIALRFRDIPPPSVRKTCGFPGLLRAEVEQMGATASGYRKSNWRWDAVRSLLKLMKDLKQL